MNTRQQVEENIGTMRPFQPLTQLQMARALEAGRLIRTSTAVPCTACRDCDGCPEDMAMLEYFSLYTQLSRLEKSREEAVREHVGLAQSRGVASACIGCGRCERHCPQHIGIIRPLQQAAQALENVSPP